MLRVLASCQLNLTLVCSFYDSCSPRFQTDNPVPTCIFCEPGYSYSINKLREQPTNRTTSWPCYYHISAGVHYFPTGVIRNGFKGCPESPRSRSLRHLSSREALMSLQTYRIKIRPDGLLKYLNDSLKIHIFYAYIGQIFSCEYILYLYNILYLYCIFVCKAGPY